MTQDPVSPSPITPTKKCLNDGRECDGCVDCDSYKPSPSTRNEEESWEEEYEKLCGVSDKMFEHGEFTKEQVKIKDFIRSLAAKERERMNTEFAVILDKKMDSQYQHGVRAGMEKVVNATRVAPNLHGLSDEYISGLGYGMELVQTAARAVLNQEPK